MDNRKARAPDSTANAIGGQVEDHTVLREYAASGANWQAQGNHLTPRTMRRVECLRPAVRRAVRHAITDIDDPDIIEPLVETEELLFDLIDEHARRSCGPAR